MSETTLQAGADKQKVCAGVGSEIGVSRDFAERFAKITKLITRDLNNLRNMPTFSKYKKNDITIYLTDPYRYERQLRRAVIYIYGASSLFRRVIQYFVGLNDGAYVVAPSVDPAKANVETVRRNYRKVLNALSAMRLRTELPKILTVCLREDVYYGTMWVNNEDIVIQQLPSDYCQISSIEEGVPNVTFNFTYFDAFPALLGYYPEEFTVKYHMYEKDKRSRWIELDSPNSFAVKCNADILDYAMPPFIGILRDLYDLEDYRDLKLTKEALENYALLVMKLAMDDEGNWLLDYDKAVDFWRNLDSVMPEEVATVLSPMEIDKIGFDKSNTGDTDTVTNATENVFTTAGVSSMLFANTKASANALLLSIKADQMITFGIVKNFENVINRFLHHQSYGRYWKCTFLDTSPYNRKEMGDQYLKACEYGVPMISYYCASQGLGQAEIDSMSYLEGMVLGLQDMFRPLRNSAQTSDNEQKNPVGRPMMDDDEITDSGIQTREDGDDW